MNAIQKQTIIEIAVLIAAVALTAALSGCTSAPELPPEPSGETVPVPRFATEARAPVAPVAPVAPGTFAGLTAPGTALPGARPAPSTHFTPDIPANTPHRAAAPNPASAAQGD